jgi:hypothetical protein
VPWPLDTDLHRLLGDDGVEVSSRAAADDLGDDDSRRRTGTPVVCHLEKANRAAAPGFNPLHAVSVATAMPARQEA